MTESLNFQRGVLKRLAWRVEMAHAFNTVARVLGFDKRPYREITAHASAKRRGQGIVTATFYQMAVGKLPIKPPEGLTQDEIASFPEPGHPEKTVRVMAQDLKAPLSKGAKQTHSINLRVGSGSDTDGILREQILIRVDELPEGRRRRTIHFFHR